MKICFISDTHKHYTELVMPEADVLVHSGDFDIYENISELQHFKRWLDKLPYKRKIIVAGNHDRMFALANDLCRSIIKDSCDYLENSQVVIDGVKFWGSPITPTFCNWYFMADRGDEIKRYWDMIPIDTDVLITHGPPLKILDELIDTKENVGCWDLRHKVMKMSNLRIHAFGHIHREKDDVRMIQIGRTKFINASNLNDYYEVANQPIVIEI